MVGWFHPTARAAPPPPSSYSDNDDSQRAWDESTSGADLDARPSGEELDETDEADDDDSPEFVSPDRAAAIRAVRLLLLGALVTAGTLVSASIYLLTARNLEQDEQVDVEFMSRRVSRTVSERLVNVLGDVDLLATDIRLAAQESASSWPMVTVPRFEERASKVRRTHHLRKVILLPVVEDWSREMWGAFSVTQWEGWFNESVEYYSLFEDHLLSSEMKNETEDIACGHESHVNATSTTRLPVSQWSPPFTHDGDGDACLVTPDQLKTANQAISSGLASFGVEIPEAALDKETNRSVDAIEPVLTLAYPIVDPSSKVVAILLTSLTWNHLLERALVKEETALVSVSVSFPSDVQSVMLFAVDQDGASLLGTSGFGDSTQHSLTFTSLSFLEEEWNARSDIVPVGGAELLNVRVDWVATTTTTSQNPTLYAVIVIVFFLLCILLFAVYDRLVQQQRRQVMKHAKRNFRIVKSLFPAGVRDRLLEQQEQATITSTRHTKASLETKSNRAASELGDRLSVADLEHGRDLSESSDATRTVENIPGHGSPTKVMRTSPKRRLRSFLRDRENFSGFTREDDNASVVPSNTMEQKPIADLFPSCTILFADIAGFTAWSSERDPTQVFMLLGAIYAAFDKVARRRKVFKVETIGDSYVAVTGLPDPQPDHAWIMAQFALDCRNKMREVTRKLERTLGPETGDLDMRFGLHSGAVTAGVLVGERARFQLFGDSVNTASRMESTGMRNCIQVSEATATFLNEAGKGHWLVKREGTVSVKGKGEMQTYWLEPREESFPRRRASLMSTSTSSGQSVSTSPASAMTMPDLFNGGKPIRGMLQAQKSTTVWGTSEVFDTMPPALTRCSSDPTYRLIDWNVDVLLRLLKQVVFQRSKRSGSTRSLDGSSSAGPAPSLALPPGTKALDEVAEIIDLPSFDPSRASVAVDEVDTDAVQLDEEIEIELRDYVTAIASMYRDNFFHNFEHACHVQMSMIKLLQRVVTPDDADEEGERSTQDAHTYGIIASDPLTQFAVVFSALIHDVDHCGVANGQLIKENSPIATYYDGKSVAEQNSIDLAWELLMDEKFESLRRCIYTNDSELKRFRQLVVNVVLATDIFDKELSALRKTRWSKAFSDPTRLGASDAEAFAAAAASTILHDESHIDQVNRKATIVLEHLIQASDVSHTMQHFDIYRKWNERLFYEMYSAFRSGRTDSDPSAGWYGGELWFFDNYVIPLAKKLRECGVFGVSSDECLNYATENRRLWAEHGEQIVQELLQTDYISRLRSKPHRGKRRVRSKDQISDGLL